MNTSDQKPNTQSIEKMIGEVLQNTKTEILNREEDAKIYDRRNALRLIDKLSSDLPQALSAAEILGNTICCQTTPTGWSLQIDATTEIQLDEEGSIVSKKHEKVKYFVIDIEFASHPQNDDIINELDITNRSRYVSYPPLEGCTTLPEALNSETSLAESYTTFTFDRSNHILSYVAKMDFFEGIHLICDWRRE